MPQLEDYKLNIAAVYRVFYHKNALRIVKALDEKSETQTGLMAALGIPKGTLSRHVNDLLAANLIDRDPETRELSLSMFGGILLEDWREYARALYDKQT